MGGCHLCVVCLGHSAHEMEHRQGGQRYVSHQFSGVEVQVLPVSSDTNNVPVLLPASGQSEEESDLMSQLLTEKCSFISKSRMPCQWEIRERAFVTPYSWTS